MSSGPPTVDASTAPRVVHNEADALGAQLCELAGHIHAATAELMGLLGRLDATGGWQGPGIRSLGHWASIHLGIDLRTAAQQAQVGRQLDTLPAIRAAAGAGALGWCKLRLLARVAEPASETKWLGLAREMSVGQLARVVGAYRRAADTDDPERAENHRQRRGIWLFDQPDGLVRITGLLEPDDAAVLRAALAAQCERLWRHGRRDRGTADRPDRPDDTGGTHGESGRTSNTDASDTDDRPTPNGDAADPPGESGKSDAGKPGDTDPDEPDDRPTPSAGEPRGTGEPGGTDDASDTDRPSGTDEPGESDADESSESSDSDEPGGTAEDGGSGAGDGGVGEPARPSELDPTLAARDPVASRRADALVALARAALAGGGVPDDGDDLTEVLVVVDRDVLSLACEVGRCQLHNGPAINAHTARRLCCDALIRPLIHRQGQPLDLGRAQRLVNRAQRRALRFRDGPGCAFPGCGARHVDAHHLLFWTDGGRTDLDNLVLLCRHHHRLLHEGGYTAALVGGRPRFYRPDGTPLRPPDPPPPDPTRGSPALRRRHRAAGHTIDQRTPQARSGGAPWSPQPALDALLT